MLYFIQSEVFSMKKQIGEKIRNLRLATKLNQNELAEILNVTQASLSAYETGNKLPSLDVLIRISEHFNVSLDWLCNNQGHRNIVTMADIIQTLSEINNIDGLELNIDPTKNLSAGPEGTYKYSCEISFNSYFNEYVSAEDNHCASHLCKFIYDWKTTMDQLKHLTDNEIIENYKQMWWDKQIAYYSNIPVKIKKDAEDKTSEEAEIRLPLIGKVDFEL